MACLKAFNRLTLTPLRFLRTIKCLAGRCRIQARQLRFNIMEPERTSAEAFDRDIPTLLGFIIRGSIWDIPVLIFGHVPCLSLTT